MEESEMSNPWSYDVDALANSPKEISEITEHLKNPSARLASIWAARKVRMWLRLRTIFAT